MRKLFVIFVPDMIYVMISSLNISCQLKFVWSFGNFFFFSHQNSRLIFPLNQYITRENAFLTLPIDLYPVLLITFPLHELYKRLFFPVSNSSWLTLMYMQTIQSKKETNYHSYNYCCLFYSSMAYVIAFREKTIICKRRYSILIVEQFPSIRFARRFLPQS